jgi:hypothetical protein
MATFFISSHFQNRTGIETAVPHILYTENVVSARGLLKIGSNPYSKVTATVSDFVHSHKYKLRFAKGNDTYSSGL